MLISNYTVTSSLLRQWTLWGKMENVQGFNENRAAGEKHMVIGTIEKHREKGDKI